MNTNQGEGAVRNRGRRAWLAQWAGDLRLGVRLAIGGGRTSKTGVARLVLGTIGIGLAVGVLLVGAAAGPMFNARNDRQNAQAERTSPRSGVDPLYVRPGGVEFRDQYIAGSYLNPSGPRPPLPPGVAFLPGDGEILVSPALQKLLNSPAGELLRPRLPQRIVGTIDKSGVTDAGSLSFYAGDKTIRPGADLVHRVFGYGARLDRQIPPSLVLLIVMGSVVLLVPVFVFVATSARIAGAERDRRLAALRLVGVDSRQARRIAAAESLVSAGTGLIFGIGLFLAFRSVVGNFPVLGVSPYPEDLTPPWSLALLVVLSVPLLAVVTAQVALRRTIIEPLGVVRRGRPARRRLWWRLVPLVLGPLVLLNQGTITHRPDGWEPAVVAGAALLLLGIPAVLPWLLERAVARLRGGRPAVQLAIRRLQLDSGTPARVVGGVAVVLAGAIALDAVLASQAAKYDVPSYLRVQHSDLVPTVQVYVEGADPAPVADGIRSVQGVRSAVMVRELTVDVDNGRSMYGLAVVDCETLLRYAAVKRCTDGDVFRPAGDRGGELTPGRTVTLRGSGGGTDRQTGVPWTVPGGIEEIDLAGNYIGYGTLLLTPGALGDVRVPASLGRVMVFADLGQPDLLERIRNTVVPYGSKVHVSAMYSTSRPETLDLLLTIRNGLLGGALFTLLLAGISMLVLALEQMRERRRPLAALAATGVPTGTLARSLLWQNTVPVLLAVVVAVITGIGLAGLVFRMIDEPFAMDWGSVAIYSGVATVLVLLVTAMTLPTLRSATRLAALRTE